MKWISPALVLGWTLAACSTPGASGTGGTSTGGTTDGYTTAAATGGSSTGRGSTSGASSRGAAASSGSSDRGTSSAASTGGVTATLGGTAGTSGSSGGGTTGSAPPAGAPLVLYTDIVAGPNSGGENNDGAYLSIFGKNFGGSGLGTNVHVTLGGVEVASYRTLGPSLGRADIQQITVQVGALGNPTPGTALPIEVSVNGVSSNTDQTFTVNAGRMLFVDNVAGNDATAVPGDITHPFQHVQLTSSATTALGVAAPGDTIVLRGKGTPYSDLGYANDFVKVIDVGGSAPTGASGSGYLAFLAYPGETVNIVNGSGGLSDAAAFSSFDHTQSGYSGGNFVVISGLHVEGDGTAGVVCIQVASDHWRVVNDELFGPNTANAAVLAGGVNGNGTNISIYGNSIHDITGSQGEDHGVYMDGDGSYEVAYNVIYNVTSGYGIQAYNDSGPSPTTSNVHVHHNLIHDVTGKGCLNVADGSATNHEWWDNVCYNINLSCLKFNDSGTLSGAQIFNNTFYNCGSGDAFDGAIDNEGDQLAATALTLVNNIVYPASGVPYAGGSGSGFASSGVFSHNVWFGGSGAPPADPGAVTANPNFVDAGSDFHLSAGSPALGAGDATVLGTVTSDFDLDPLSAGSSVDIGAY